MKLWKSLKKNLRSTLHKSKRKKKTKSNTIPLVEGKPLLGYTYKKGYLAGVSYARTAIIDNTISFLKLNSLDSYIPLYKEFFNSK